MKSVYNSFAVFSFFLMKFYNCDILYFVNKRMVVIKQSMMVLSAEKPYEGSSIPGIV